MAMHPIYINFQMDFVPLLLPVDTEMTMDEVASAAAEHVIDRRVDPPGENLVLRVRLHRETTLLSRDMKVSDAGFRVGETVDVVFTDPETEAVVGPDEVANGG